MIRAPLAQRKAEIRERVVSANELAQAEKAPSISKEVWKPDISKLPDAVVDGKLVVPVGQHMIVQYPEPWRETVNWRIQFVYDETLPTEVVEAIVDDRHGPVKRTFLCVKGTTCRPGHVRLFDPQKNQYGATNYLEAQSKGLVLKVWTGKIPK